MDLFPDLLDSLNDDKELKMAAEQCDNVINPGWMLDERASVAIELVDPGEDEDVRHQQLIRQLDIFAHDSESSGDSSPAYDHDYDGSSPHDHDYDGASLPPSPPPSARSDKSDTSSGTKRQRRYPAAYKKRAAARQKADESAGLSKNAIAARENRIKKKEYVSGLENSVRHLAGENTRLVQLSDQLKERSDSLAAEVSYLRSVLANVDEIASLVRSVRGGSPGLAFGSSISATGNEIKPAVTRAKAVAARGPAKKVSSATAGVCLHVNNRKVSLEFCPRCSVSAASGVSGQTE